MASAAILNFALKYSLYTDLITFTIGFIGNTLNILVFTHLKCFRKNRYTLYLTVEAICILIIRTLAIIFTISASIYQHVLVADSTIWCKLQYIVFPSASLVIYTMMSLAAIDQFLSTNYRLHLRQICTLRLAKYFVVASVCIWVLHSLLFSFFVFTDPLLGCIIFNPIWMRYSTFFYYPVLTLFLPIVLASVFSFLAYRNVRRIVRRQIPIERRRFDRQITAMVLLRVVIFVLSVFLYNSYRIYAINVTINRTDSLRYAIQQLVQVIFNSLISLNYAINFYVFIIVFPRYRRQVKYVLTKIFWQRWKKWFCSEVNQVAPEAAISSESNIELQ